jgi:hypothetical protein
MLLTSIVDGMNQKTEIQYSSLALQDDHDPQLALSFPFSRVNGAMYVVDTVKQYNLEGYLFYDPATYMQTAYFYRGGIMHRQGIGFLGFQEREIHGEKLHTLCEYELDTASKGVYLQKKTIKKNNGSFASPVLTTLTETIYDNAPIRMAFNTGKESFIPLVEKTITRDSVYETETVVLDTFYTDGNLKSRTSLHGSEQSPIKTEKQEYWYRVLLGFDRPNKLDSVRTTRTHSDDGGNTYERMTHYFYGSDYVGMGQKKRSATVLDVVRDPRLAAIVSDPGTTFEVRDSLNYDDFGNVTKRIITAPNDADIGTIISQYEWSANGRYKTAEISPDNMRVDYAYDSGLDVRVRTTFYGNTSNADTIIYDAWRRPIETRSHDGVITSDNLLWAIPSSNPFRSLVAHHHTSNNDYTVSTYTDVWGNTFRTKALLMHNKVSLTDAIVDKWSGEEKVERFVPYYFL